MIGGSEDVEPSEDHHSNKQTSRKLPENGDKNQQITGQKGIEKERPTSNNGYKKVEKKLKVKYN